VPWIPSVLYAAVLLAGAYAWIVGLGDTRPTPFVAGLIALFLLDRVELRRYPDRTPLRPAVVLLVVRTVLTVAIVVADGSGLSRALFVLLPYTAYFAFGRAVSIALGVACAAAVVVAYQATIPRWYVEPEQVSDLLMFCVGLVLTIAMASVAAEEQRGRARLEVSHARLREYAEQVSDLSATAERNRLARDIHDGLGHHLTAIAVLLEKADTFRDRDPDAAARAVADARRSARRALDDVRASVRSLRVEAAPFRLGTALDDLVRQVTDDRLAVSLDLIGDESRYDATTLTALYRAAQEGITNARRHARANRVDVRVDLDPVRARLVVADDGCGFPPDREGFGLTGMRERIRLSGGSVDVDSGDGTGTRLTVTIPAPSPSRAGPA
jgi:signal transduction histidine kinase